MKKIVLLIFLLAVAAPNYLVAGNYYYSGGDEIRAITSLAALSPRLEAMAEQDGKNFCVDTYIGSFCYKFSEIVLFFDKNLKGDPLLASSNKYPEVLVFKDYKQFRQYIPDMFIGKIKIVKDL